MSRTHKIKVYLLGRSIEDEKLKFEKSSTLACMNTLFGFLAEFT